MQFRTSAFQLAVLAGAALIAAAGCDDTSSPSPVDQAPAGQAPESGVVSVRGGERLVWNQEGDVTNLRFRAYVDDQPVALDAALCDRTVPLATCGSPLPPLSSGVHTLSLVSVLSGIESVKTGAIRLQKTAATATLTAASLPDAIARSRSVGLETIVTPADGFDYAVDVVTRNLRGPVQLAALPDGRLLVAQGDGVVGVMWPGGGAGTQTALDSRGLSRETGDSPLGMTSHPNFLHNHFVYVSFLERQHPGSSLLRLVRLREVGDTLGEPATLFQTVVAVDTSAYDASASARPLSSGPRLAFGPDGMLYVALPEGLQFENEPAASRPVASILRLTDAGRVEPNGSLSGVTASPLGFTFHPSTGALWVALPSQNGEAALGPVTTGPSSGAVGAESTRPQRVEGAGRPGRAWRVQRAESRVLELARAYMARPRDQVTGTVRLAAPLLATSLLPGMVDRIGDVVVGADGTLFVATSNAETGEGSAAVAVEAIVRLRPRGGSR